MIGCHPHETRAECTQGRQQQQAKLQELGTGPVWCVGCHGSWQERLADAGLPGNGVEMRTRGGCSCLLRLGQSRQWLCRRTAPRETESSLKHHNPDFARAAAAAELTCPVRPSSYSITGVRLGVPPCCGSTFLLIPKPNVRIPRHQRSLIRSFRLRLRNRLFSGSCCQSSSTPAGAQAPFCFSRRIPCICDRHSTEAS